MSVRWRQVFLFAIAVNFGFVQCDHHGCSPGYDRWLYLDGETQKYFLCWKVDWSDQSITFEAKVATTGWVGLGFSPTGLMPESDVVIGWVKDGRGYLKDRYTIVYRTVPPIDALQNVQLLSSSEADGVTTLEFKRKLVACEPNDRSIEEGTTRVIFSYNDNDPVSEDSPAQHQVAGRVSVNLLSGTGNLEPGPLEADHTKFNLLNPNVSVPARPTTYWCSPFKFPVLQNEAHIIRFDPVVQEGHEELVHHILMYQCSNVIEPFLDVSWDCDNPPDNIPGAVRRCRQSAVITSWAIGGAGLTLPSNVGLPMSGATGVQYVLMETHYNNEQSSSTLVDSSGMDVYYTTTKRQYDGAIIEVGHFVTNHLLIPPGVGDVDFRNTCPERCTQAGLPPGGVNVFASMLHSHTAGTAVWVEHYRNKTKLPNIDQNFNYDFNFQDTVLLRNEVKILPGDDIQVYCRYDTSDRTAVTVGGEGTSDEMCLAFFVVYPKPDIAVCLSRISDGAFLKFITSAIIAGYYTNTVNDSADDATQSAQFAADLQRFKFSSPASIQLWRDEYLASKARVYYCASPSVQIFDQTVLEDIEDTTTMPGTAAPCLEVSNTTEEPSGGTREPSGGTEEPSSAVRLFASFTTFAVVYVMVYMTVG